MELAINNLYKLSKTHKIAILGDMFELGDSSIKEHQNIVDLIDGMNLDRVFLIGSNFSKTDTKKASKYESFSDFIKIINFNDFKNSTILIKGSRGMALERILDSL